MTNETAAADTAAAEEPIAERLLNDFAETREALLFASDVHFTRANFFESERLARRCLEEFPDDCGGAIFLSRALLALRRTGEAQDLALSMADKDIMAAIRETRDEAAKMKQVCGKTNREMEEC